ncbi:glutamine-hydrolyzing carbamoyl-phosphate synthase small subunit [soil metagenome]
MRARGARGARPEGEGQRVRASASEPGGRGSRGLMGEPARAVLVLEDGTTFHGEGFGAAGTAFGEVVFNTAMSGYQEVLTDPSYRRQLVAMTYPHQGSYGITADDDEADGVQVAGFVVRSVARRASNHRSVRSLPDLLTESGVVGITEVDTRRLTRHLRDRGALRGAISTAQVDVDALVADVRAQPEMAGADLTSGVGVRAAVTLPAAGERRFRVVACDYGCKRSQLRLLAARGCEVVLVPGATPAAQVLAMEPDGVFLSNGPGDPSAVGHAVAAIRALLTAGVPTFGICLGHQLLGLAVGARTYKLRFGHHGVNHPVRNVARGTVEIASHNHGFAVDTGSLPGGEGPFGRVIETHVNLNDGTNAGLRCLDVPAFSVQYHPESAPGPHDSRYLFADFVTLMEGR